MTESIQLLQNDLTTIRWLLVGLLVVALVFVVLFAVTASIFISVIKRNMRDRHNDFTRSELDDLLATGKAREVKYTALDWLVREPKRADAFWALAKAHHQLGELTDAKRVLQELLKISPDQEYQVSSWLALIEQDFMGKKPKAVE